MTLSAEILVGADRFWPALAADLGTAREDVVLQVMAFGGDKVGRMVAKALRTSPARRKRLLVDHYSRFMQRFRFVYSPSGLVDAAMRRRVRIFRRIVQRLTTAGTEVRFTNPVGFLLHRFPARNHKKLVVVDRRIAYLGGFNFTEHNFTWHDLMLRIEDEAVASFIGDDLERSWAGPAPMSCARFPGCDLYLLDGETNESVFDRVLDVLGSARRSLHVVSPYLTSPFLERLEALPRRGVAVTVLTPRANNRPIVRDHLVWQAHRSGFDVRLFPGMSHMKAALVDDRLLVLGSSNFDVLSYRVEQEVVAVLSDPNIVAQFRQKVLLPDLARSERYDGKIVGPMRGWICAGILRALEGVALASRALSGRRLS